MFNNLLIMTKKSRSEYFESFSVSESFKTRFSSIQNRSQSILYNLLIREDYELHSNKFEFSIANTNLVYVKLNFNMNRF